MLDRSEIGKRGYLHEDYRLFHLRDCRAVKLDYHYHEFDKLVFHIEGRTEYHIEGKSYPLSNVMAVGKLPEKVDPPETDDKEDGDGEGNGEVTDPDKTPEVPDEDAKG